MDKPENEDIKNPDNSEKESKDKTKGKIVNFNDYDRKPDGGNIMEMLERGGENDDELFIDDDEEDDEPFH